MSVEYKSQNVGLLLVDNVKEGDKLVLIEDAYVQFSESKQKNYWNCKVKLPDGTIKLAGLMETSCDKFAEKWGKMTGDWTGHTAQVNIKISKAGNQYIFLIPTDDPIVDVIVEQVMPMNVAPKNDNEGVSYPEASINPNDIPF